MYLSIRAPVNLVEPLLDVVERLLVGDVIHHNNAVGSPVVRRRDGAEPLLPRGVPLFSQANARVEFPIGSVSNTTVF